MRRDSRFPLRWPATLTTADGATPVMLRDISLRGFFAADCSRVPEGSFKLQIPQDQNEPPLELRGRVARVVDGDIAVAHKCVEGFGVAVELKSNKEAKRYREFVDRVSQRAYCQVLIGASGRRLSTLSAELTAAGYQCAGFEDAKQLYRHVLTAKTAPNLVLLDATLRRSRVDTLKSKLRNQTPVLSVACPPEEARRLADATLLPAA